MLKFTDKSGKTIATLDDDASEPVFVVVKDSQPKPEPVVAPVVTEEKPDADLQ